MNWRSCPHCRSRNLVIREKKWTLYQLPSYLSPELILVSIRWKLTQDSRKCPFRIICSAGRGLIFWHWVGVGLIKAVLRVVPWFGCRLRRHVSSDTLVQVTHSRWRLIMETRCVCLRIPHLHPEMMVEGGGWSWTHPSPKGTTLFRPAWVCRSFCWNPLKPKAGV